VSNFDAMDLDGNRFSSKKRFKEAVAATPTDVKIVCYDALGPHVGASYRVAEMPENEVLIVVGDPFVRRNWFANIRRQGDRITVQ
jgi:hypothetical protein